jgi:hypothetical protein
MALAATRRVQEEFSLFNQATSLGEVGRVV